MDKVAKYRSLLMQLLSRHASLLNSSSTNFFSTHTIFDETSNRYMLLRTGWLGKKRINSSVLYARLEQGKFWIEEDYTEEGIATELLAAGVPGVPHEDIVLAFRHPMLRPYTEFAVA